MLLEFVQPLLLGLLLQELGVLLLVEGSLLIPEDVADEAVRGLLRRHVLLLTPPMIYQLKLSL